MQLHRASRLHFDFRLEFDGVFKSWAVPKGPSLNPLDQRLAVFVEDHPIKYGSFEGTIPKGNYGAGTVMIWDEGTYVERSSSGPRDSNLAMQKGLEKGHLTFVLSGHKLNGEFALIRLKKSADEKPWLLVKKRDAHSTYKRDSQLDDRSVKTGRSMDEIAEKSKDVWLPKRNEKNKISKKPATQIEAPEKFNLKQKAERQRAGPRMSDHRPRQPVPRKIKPMLPLASRVSPNGAQWIFEADHEGLRAIAEVEKNRSHLYSKSFLSFDKKFPHIIKELESFDKTMVLDGKILTRGKKSVYEIFDILFFDGHDLRNQPLRQRKQILQTAFSVSAVLQRLSPLKNPKEGDDVVAKNLDSLYHSGISRDWLQVTILSSTKRPPNFSKSSSMSPEEARLTHLDKVFFPEDKITKGDLLEYYRKVSAFILPHLKDRPESLNRHPNGIHSAGFYQKDMTGYHPRWLKTVRLFSESADKSIDYVAVQDERSLLYIVNLGCIEINPWFSRIGSLENPDFLVIDLDPDGNPFSEVIEIAHAFNQILNAIGAENYCKTSGASGIHIGVPLGAKYDFETARNFSESVCEIVNQKYPKITSMERNPQRRRNKIYLDYMQNRKAQTLAAPYCIRPQLGAPVSMPLRWKELTAKVTPGQFNIHNAPQRITKVGDLWGPILHDSVDLAGCLKALQRKFPKN